MLRFRLHQVHVPSLERYFLPLPKLADSQLADLSSHLKARGFTVRGGSNKGRVVALKGTQRIAVDGALGLASSSADLLDALAPAIPDLLGYPRQEAWKVTRDVAARYFSLKRSGTSAKLQLFPRLESLSTWTCLRKDGLSGLTADEAAVLKHLLGKAQAGSQIECVTARPRKGSSPLQIGRNLYHRSAIPVTEFLSSLRTIESGAEGLASYMPRDSVIALHRVRIDTRLVAEELGEWCYLGEHSRAARSKPQGRLLKG
jgi:hypothetical protein